MLNVSTTAPSRAASSAAMPIHLTSPARTADARTGVSRAAHPVSQRVGALHDGRNMEGLERVSRSLSPSMLAAIEAGGRGLAWSGDAVSRARGGASLSAMERVYEWCGDTATQFFGGLAVTEPSARRGERDALRMGPAPEQASAPGARVKRNVPDVSFALADFLARVEPRLQQPRFSTARGQGGGALEGALRHLEVGLQQPHSSAARRQGGSTLEDDLRHVEARLRPRPSRGRENDRVSLEEARPSQTRCNMADRADRIDYFRYPEHANPSLCPPVSRTVSRRISAQAAAATGVRRTLAGEQGVLTRVHVALPSDAARLTVKVSREGATPETDTATWNRHTGIEGVVASVVSGDADHPVPNLANCQPTEPRTGKQVCTIPIERGRVDGKRFVTVEVLATAAGTPILLEVASQPA